MTLPSQPPVHDLNRTSYRPSGSALVLAGGGSTGNAWAIGVVAGLTDAGCDPARADVTIGTSSGATAAAQVTGATATELYAAVLAEVAPQRSPGATPTRGRVADASDLLAATSAVIGAASDAADMRRRIGAAALEAADASARWRDVVAARLPSPDWPQQRLLITAVDAVTGEPVVFDRDSGVALVDAVAASTSHGSAYTIGERRYVDGGYRRNENADLAAGCALVLVLSPFGGRSRHPQEWGMDLATQTAELSASGSRVVTVVPGRGSEFMAGAGAMDLARRPAAARAGYEQGRALAPGLIGDW